MNPSFKNCLSKKEVEESPCLETIPEGVSPVSFRKMTRNIWDDWQKWQTEVTIMLNRNTHNVCSMLLERESLFPTAGAAVGETLPFSAWIVFFFLLPVIGTLFKSSSGTDNIIFYCANSPERTNCDYGTSLLNIWNTYYVQLFPLLNNSSSSLSDMVCTLLCPCLW